MPEPTLSEIMDALTALSAQVSALALAVDDTRANLSQHRREIGVRTTEMDLAMRAEIAVVQGAVDELKPDIAILKTQQTASDVAQAALGAKLDNLGTKQDSLSADVAAIAPKLDEVRTKQDQMIQQSTEPTP